MKTAFFSFLFICIAGCSETNENPPIKVGGNIIKINGDNYKIQTLIDKDSEPKSVDAKLIESTKNPLEPLISIIQSWDFTTTECGYLYFQKSVSGKVLCTNCDEISLSHKECPLEFGAINTLDFNVQD